MGDNGEYDSLVSVDGTDCKTTNQGQCPLAFYSFKFRSSGLRYEVCVCIITGHIVWISGPFPPGDWPDLSIFRHALINALDEGERVEADDGYIGEDPNTTITPGGIRFMEPKITHKIRGRVRNRQESVNERLKLFSCIGGTFRHELAKHSQCFRACAVLTQISFQYGKGLWSVEDAWKQQPLPMEIDPSQVPLPDPSSDGL
jgi:hypothetical protein